MKADITLDGLTDLTRDGLWGAFWRECFARGQSGSRMDRADDGAESVNWLNLPGRTVSWVIRLSQRAVLEEQEISRLQRDCNRPGRSSAGFELENWHISGNSIYLLLETRAFSVNRYFTLPKWTAFLCQFTLLFWHLENYFARFLCVHLFYFNALNVNLFPICCYLFSTSYFVYNILWRRTNLLSYKKICQISQLQPVFVTICLSKNLQISTFLSCNVRPPFCHCTVL